MSLIFDALTRHATERPEATALRLADRRMSWAELARMVARAAAGFAAGPHCVGLRLDGLDAVVAELAAMQAGCRIVPVPAFFSQGQVAHLLNLSGAALVTRLPEGTGPVPDASGRSDRVIFTSGTTGTPKGVVLGAGQIMASVAALAGALQPGPTDRYLSVLPLSQLLEQICGILLPVLAGAETILCPEGQALLWGKGDTAAFARAALEAQPTVTVLAPRQLALWVAAARAGAPVPSSLRHVAVGGAPTAQKLMEEARSLGIPAHPGYGLSEACSVVALSRPGDALDGSAGRVLDGLRVEIVAGEVVVSGPTVMAGYLGRDAQTGPWATGDLGRIENGRLWIEGRKDALIVLANGRKVSPEWVEAEALADPAILAAALLCIDERLILAIAPGGPFDSAALARRLATLPDYARPERIATLDPRTPGLIRPSGTADRKIAAQEVLEAIRNPQEVPAT